MSLDMEENLTGNEAVYCAIALSHCLPYNEYQAMKLLLAL